MFSLHLPVARKRKKKEKGGRKMKKGKYPNLGPKKRKGSAVLGFNVVSSTSEEEKGKKGGEVQWRVTKKGEGEKGLRHPAALDSCCLPIPAPGGKKGEKKKRKRKKPGTILRAKQAPKKGEKKRVFRQVFFSSISGPEGKRGKKKKGGEEATLKGIKKKKKKGGGSRQRKKGEKKTETKQGNHGAKQGKKKEKTLRSCQLLPMISRRKKGGGREKGEEKVVC